MSTFNYSSFIDINVTVSFIDGGVLTGKISAVDPDLKLVWLNTASGSKMVIPISSIKCIQL